MFYDKYYFLKNFYRTKNIYNCILQSPKKISKKTYFAQKIFFPVHLSKKFYYCILGYQKSPKKKTKNFTIDPP